MKFTMENEKAIYISSKRCQEVFVTNWANLGVRWLLDRGKDWEENEFFIVLTMPVAPGGTAWREGKFVEQRDKTRVEATFQVPFLNYFSVLSSIQVCSCFN